MEEQREHYDELYKLGLNLYRQRRMRKASRVFARALASAQGRIPSLYRDYALCLSEAGDLSRAMQVIQEGLVLYPDYADLYFLQGVVYFDSGLLEAAQIAFLRCTQFVHAPPAYFSIDGVNGRLAYENLAEISELNGNLEEALEYTRLALITGPSLSLLERCGKLLSKAQFSGEILLQYLMQQEEFSLQEVARLLYSCGFYRHCLNFLGTIPELPGSQLLGLKCRQKLRDPGNDSRHIEDTPTSPELVKEACLLLWQAEPRRDAHNLLEQVQTDEHPMIRACRYINQAYFDGCHIPDDRETQSALQEIMADLLELGDLDFALKAAQKITGRQSTAWTWLGRIAFAHQSYPLARRLLERGGGEELLALGKCYQSQGEHAMAFQCFWESGKKDNGEESLAFALSQLSAALRRRLLEALDKSHPNSHQINQVLRLATLEKQSHEVARQLAGAGRENRFRS